MGSRGSFPETRVLVLSELMRGDIRTRIARTSFNAQEPRHAATRGSCTSSSSSATAITLIVAEPKPSDEGSC